MITVKRCVEVTEWDTLVDHFQGHPLQLWGWGEVKAAHGWRAERLMVLENEKAVGGAQVLIKRLPKPFPPFLYVPRGPFGKLLESEKYRQALEGYVKKHFKPLVLSVEPDTEGKLHWSGWRESNRRILLARTAVLDLSQEEEALLAAMSKKTRQYIRKSAKEGTTVRLAETLTDIDACLAIYKETAERAGFRLHDDAYYHDIFTNLKENSPVYLAEADGEVVAFLWPLVANQTAFELYGGMSDRGQALRANYHLKWYVIQAMKMRGVQRYDVNGLLNDGVTAFKKGFIPEETMKSGTYDRPLSSLYPVWIYFLPLAKKILRAARRS